MSPNESAVSVALETAQESIRAAAGHGVVEVAHSLLDLMRSANTYRARGQFANAHSHVLNSQKQFLPAFASALGERVQEELVPQEVARPAAGETDWKSIGLVEHDEIEEQLSANRIAQLINHGCEAELRELEGYMQGLLGLTAATGTSRNPLRAEVLGYALLKSIERTCEDPEIQKIIGREFGNAFALAMPACYREIIGQLKQRGVHAAERELRPLEPPPPRQAQSAGVGVAPTIQEARKAWEASWRGPPAGAGEPVGPGGPPGRRKAPDESESPSTLLDRLIRGGMPGLPALPSVLPSDAAATAADVEFMSLLRRINGSSGAARHGAAPSVSGFDAGVSGGPGAGLDGAPMSGERQGAAASASAGISDLIAVNLIRTHRDELMRASRGRLDHLVIEVVSSLFDQIFSDTRVSPQMARLIARLQLPVLRVALRDPDFFASRRHPVRRFINRIASLAASFDGFEDGQGQELLARVGQLVTEIVEGDFDRIDLYDAKLVDLEAFITERTQAEIRESTAAETLRTKELEWHTQQRFSWRLNAALEPLGLPPFVREFLAGDWGQAIVLASRRDGPDAPYTQQLRRTGSALVKSIQPQRSLEERKQFLAGLPTLMAELREGMAFVGLPEMLKEDFLGQLIAQHAGSLKGAPQTDLDHNLLVRHLDMAFSIAVPSADESGEEALPEGARVPAVEQHFLQAEGAAIGLVSETVVDWAVVCEPEASVDLALPLELPPGALTRERRVAVTGGGFPDIAFPQPGASSAGLAGAADAAAPAPSAAQLIEELQLGLSYRLNLQSHWERIRLTYMSPSRTLFLFNHGEKNRRTISMTRRTLSRLCDAGRMCALESAPLLDRAALGARRQLRAAGVGIGAPASRSANA